MRKLVDRAVQRGFRRFGIKGRVQRCRRNPKSPERTRPTYQVTIGFQIPGDKHFEGFEQYARHVAHIVELDLSFNDEVCECTVESLGTEGSSGVRVCSLEDIVAEKLRALLQQRTRNRIGPKHAYDISWIISHADLDLDKVSQFLVRKCNVREIEPTRAMFDDEIRERAATGYEELEEGLGAEFIAFEDAWAAVTGLVGILGIPDE